jgi:hypothetical protein
LIVFFIIKPPSRLVAPLAPPLTLAPISASGFNAALAIFSQAQKKGLFPWKQASGKNLLIFRACFFGSPAVLPR